ncbi:hypothetical protein PMAYCL1PPCAC_15460, partial [Pristionchus mayeri]
EPVTEGPRPSTYYPNGTAFDVAWWQGEKTTARLTFSDVVVLDSRGKPRYPISLGSPFTFKISLKNQDNIFTHSFFRQTIRISQFDEQSWSWVEVPTYGLLYNMAACVNGPLCPVKVKRGEISTTLDLSAHRMWLHSLKNDAAYQFEVMMTDTISNKFFSFTVQARAFTK